MPSPVSITAFYTFIDLTRDQLNALRQELMEFGKAKGMRGLVLLATEGINGTVSGSQEVIAQWKELLTQKFGEIIFKNSSAKEEVFKRWFVKIKPEIVCIKDDSIKPHGKNNHLTPEEWHKMLEQDDVVVLDARNDYEYAIGKFQGAIDPKIKRFHEFPEYVQKGEIPKDKKVLMYCTGGIRCDKAIFAMQQQGYQEVYQLEGGILAYLEKFPNGKFEGECFVFDHRTAVDQNLQPSQKYQLCPHCGDPGDMPITCYCGNEQNICTSCAQDKQNYTCSKNCKNIHKKQLALQ